MPAAKRKNAIIIGHGPLRETARIREKLKKADLVICADGGLRVARRLGVAPQVMIGDFDSAAPAMLRWARARGADLIRHPANKDKSDTELALDAAVQQGATDVEFIGVLGGRIDHTLANVELLVRAASANVRARIIDGTQEVFLAGSVFTVPGRAGDLVSLIPLTPSVIGVTLTGFRFPLRNTKIRQGSTLTLSNVITRPPAVVRFRRGRFLVVVNHR